MDEAVHKTWHTSNPRVSKQSCDGVPKLENERESLDLLILIATIETVCAADCRFRRTLCIILKSEGRSFTNNEKIQMGYHQQTTRVQNRTEVRCCVFKVCGV